MRIGEILVAAGQLKKDDLARIVMEQPRTGRRLVSLLVGRGVLDFDIASRALGEQKGVPCALAKHLEHRDTELVGALPGALARSCCALPITKTRSGALIVCVRDPSPELLQALREATGLEIVMIIAPATRLQSLVDEVYGAVPTDEFDVELGTGSPSQQQQPPAPDASLLNPDSIQLALTSLDDVRVAKDPSQSGQLRAQSTMPPMNRSIGAQPTTPPPNRPQSALGATTPSPNRQQSALAGTTPPPNRQQSALSGTTPPPNRQQSALATTPPTDRTPSSQPTQPPPTRAAGQRVTMTPVAPSLDTTKLALDQATSRDAATDLAMTFVAGRWVTGAVLAIRGDAAIGYRGHRVKLIDKVALSLTKPSLVQRAIEGRTAVKADGPVADPIVALLDTPEEAVIAPVLVGGHVVAVIAVGDPVLEGDHQGATADLRKLADALSDAYERIHRR
jgi:hypothetical protein